MKTKKLELYLNMLVLSGYNLDLSDREEVVTGLSKLKKKHVLTGMVNLGVISRESAKTIKDSGLSPEDFKFEKPEVNFQPPGNLGLDKAFKDLGRSLGEKMAKSGTVEAFNNSWKNIKWPLLSGPALADKNSNILIELLTGSLDIFSNAFDSMGVGQVIAVNEDYFVQFGFVNPNEKIQDLPIPVDSSLPSGVYLIQEDYTMFKGYPRNIDNKKGKISSISLPVERLNPQIESRWMVIGCK